MLRLVTRGRPDRSATVTPSRRLAKRVALLVLLALLATVGFSYAAALTQPGDAPWTVRSVEWVRDNGGASFVDAVENWWFTRSAPPNVAPQAADVPTLQAAGPHRFLPQQTAPPTVTIPRGIAPVRGEGRWVAGRLDSHGVPAIYTTFVQPDATHASVVAALAWIRSSDTVGHLVAGTTQPGGADWPGHAQVPRVDVPSLVATFNAGWRFQDLLGGFYQSGRYSRPLQNGAGSIVIDSLGRLTVGQWGRDVSMSPQVTAVRQNLHLIVDGGAPAPGIADASGPWGVPRNQLQFTWRSGLGVDAHGNLIYAAGDHMSLRMLTSALVAAKATRAVELDMHASMVFFARWIPGGPLGALPQKLLSSMPSNAYRYLQPDQRDFFYVTLR